MGITPPDTASGGFQAAQVHRSAGQMPAPREKTGGIL